MFKNKKEKEKFIDDIFDILDRIKRIAGIDHEFTVFVEEDDSNENAYTIGHEKVFAKIEVNVHYHTAELTLFPVAVRAWKQKKFFNLTSALCHEIAHTITEPLLDLIYQPHTSKDETKRETEYATEKISRIIDDLYFATYKKRLGKHGEWKKNVKKKVSELSTGKPIDKSKK